MKDRIAKRVYVGEGVGWVKSIKGKTFFISFSFTKSSTFAHFMAWCVPTTAGVGGNIISK